MTACAHPMDGPPQGYPVTGKRSKKKAWQGQQLQPRHAPFKQQGYRPPSTQLGPFFGAVPSLEDMRQANRKQTRHHFGGMRPTPRSWLAPILVLPQLGFIPVLARPRAPTGSGRHKYRRPPRSTPKSIPRAPEHHPVAFPPGKLGASSGGCSCCSGPALCYLELSPLFGNFPCLLQCAQAPAGAEANLPFLCEAPLLTQPLVFPLTGANPLDTPAPEIAAFPVAADKLEAEGLNSGLDFYGESFSSFYGGWGGGGG